MPTSRSYSAFLRRAPSTGATSSPVALRVSHRAVPSSSSPDLVRCSGCPCGGARILPRGCGRRGWLGSETASSACCSSRPICSPAAAETCFSSERLGALPLPLRRIPQGAGLLDLRFCASGGADYLRDFAFPDAAAAARGAASPGHPPSYPPASGAGGSCSELSPLLAVSSPLRAGRQRRRSVCSQEGRRALGAPTGRRVNQRQVEAIPATRRT